MTEKKLLLHEFGDFLDFSKLEIKFFALQLTLDFIPLGCQAFHFRLFFFWFYAAMYCILGIISPCLLFFFPLSLLYHPFVSLDNFASAFMPYILYM